MNYCDGLFSEGAALLSMCMLDCVLQLVMKAEWVGQFKSVYVHVYAGLVSNRLHVIWIQTKGNCISIAVTDKKM